MLLFRYQIEAASKLIGGREVSYIMRGDGSKQMISRPISGVLQRQAILQLLAVVTAEELSLSEEVLSLCTSASFGFEPGKSFPYLFIFLQ